MKVLQIEPSGPSAAVMERAMSDAGWAVYATDDLDDGTDIAKRDEYDLIVLDDALGDHLGVKRMRAAGVTTPILYVSSARDYRSDVEILRAGGDAVLTKPWHEDMLVALSGAVMRRFRGRTSEDIQVGNLTVDPWGKRALVAGAYVHLTKREYAILEVLATRLGHTVTRDLLMDHMYGGVDEPDYKIIDVFLCKIRRKLRLAGSTAVIDAVWGRGYRLLTADEQKAAA